MREPRKAMGDAGGARGGKRALVRAQGKVNCDEEGAIFQDRRTAVSEQQ